MSEIAAIVSRPSRPHRSARAVGDPAPETDHELLSVNVRMAKRGMRQDGGRCQDMWQYAGEWG